MNACPNGGIHAWAEAGRDDCGWWWVVRWVCGCGRWYESRLWKDGSQ